MKISYDKATDSLYIHLADRASVYTYEVKAAWFWTTTLTARWWVLMLSTPASGRISAFCPCRIYRCSISKLREFLGALFVYNTWMSP